MAMALYETYAALRTAGRGKVIFLLDASESAAQHRQAIIALVQEVLSALPAKVERALYFLGNPSAYAPNNFASRAGQWFTENRQRTSLITPIWETFSQDDTSAIVVIGSGSIFDLEDWAETPLIQRVLLVNMEESLQEEPGVAKEIIRPTAQELLQGLHDPVIRVEISGPGFMPTWWDNMEYQLQVAGGEASLVAKCLENYALALRFFAGQDEKVQATVTYASGKQNTELLESVESTALVEPEAGQLSTEELEIFRKAVKREPFTCIHCGGQHPWDTLRCLESASILGEGIYPSLQARNVKGFVLFRAEEGGVRFEIHSCNVLRLGLGEVAIKEGQKALLHRFSGHEGWIRTDAVLEPYHPIGERAYAVLL